MKKEKTYWYDEGLHKTYGDNNNGFIWGINYLDKQEDWFEVIECEWFKTRQERNRKINE
tara:strand:+ start:573 stop:749 length:177 start_codon:yes stop_codon:yes gene_type:complete